MNFLLDTNVVSEWVKSQRSPAVELWLAEQDEDRVFLSVITLAELRRGVDRLPAGSRRGRFDEWLLNDLLLRFEGRVLLIDSAVADAWGRIVVRSEAVGRSISAMDAFLAATADVHSLTLVTRNVRDFAGIIPNVLNPWTNEQSRSRTS